MGKDKPPTGSLYPRESIVCFFLFVVELAAVTSANFISVTLEQKLFYHIRVI
jgi:hypothetical protein